MLGLKINPDILPGKPKIEGAVRSSFLYKEERKG